jgi:ATP-dependent Clp protease protease subunit
MNDMARIRGGGGLPFAIGNDSDYIFVTDFDQQATNCFIEKFKQLESDPAIPIIVIYIHSYGGEASSVLAMRDIIKSSHKPVSTIAVGMAMSCGAILLASGTPGYRFAGPSTEIMVHHVAGGQYGKTEELLSSAKQSERVNEMIYRNMSKDIGISYEKFRKQIKELMNADWYLSAQEALEWGIIDAVGVPRFIQSSPSFSLVKSQPYDEKEKKARSKSKKSARKR